MTDNCEKTKDYINYATLAILVILLVCTLFLTCKVINLTKEVKHLKCLNTSSLNRRSVIEDNDYEDPPKNDSYLTPKGTRKVVPKIEVSHSEPYIAEAIYQETSESPCCSNKEIVTLKVPQPMTYEKIIYKEPQINSEEEEYLGTKMLQELVTHKNFRDKFDNRNPTERKKRSLYYASSGILMSEIKSQHF